MKITYRKLALGDSRRYRKIRLESLKAHPESFGASYEEQNSLPKLKLEEAIEQPIDQKFVIGAFDQDEIIGICAFLPFVPTDILNLSNAGTIIQMYVRSNYSGQKIGLNLTIATLREAFRISDIEQIVLGVREDNSRAIRVYEQAGFQLYHLVGDARKSGDRGYQVMVIHRDQLK